MLYHDNIIKTLPIHSMFWQAQNRGTPLLAIFDLALEKILRDANDNRKTGISVENVILATYTVM